MRLNGGIIRRLRIRRRCLCRCGKRDGGRRTCRNRDRTMDIKDIRGRERIGGPLFVVAGAAMRSESACDCIASKLSRSL